LEVKFLHASLLEPSKPLQLLFNVAVEARPGLSRVVLLGASNLTRAIGRVVPMTAGILGSPLDIIAALGHGRSYGMRSRVLVRDLPGIVQSGIWSALEHSHVPERRTFALITDIGNDIMYGASPKQVAEWVQECIDRLKQVGVQRISLTMLPIQGLRAVTPMQYRIVKSLLFPTRSLTLAQAIDRANELHARVVELAGRTEATAIEPDMTWYGFDPIHIRYARWPQAWAFILRRAFGGRQGEAAASRVPALRPSPLLWARLRMMTPERWWLAGLQRGRAQPAGVLPDGTTISLY
jgi:hypothetical protein